MRHLRGSATRRHVRDEIPFYTGTRVAPVELVANLP
jgi:chlorite dismutase